MQYVEIWIAIATQLFSIVLALIYFIHSPEGPGYPTGGVGGAHGGRRSHQDGHQEQLWRVEWAVGCADDESC